MGKFFLCKSFVVSYLSSFPLLDVFYVLLKCFAVIDAAYLHFLNPFASFDFTLLSFFDIFGYDFFERQVEKFNRLFCGLYTSYCLAVSHIFEDSSKF